MRKSERLQLGHRLRVTRLALGITDVQAAKAWGISLTTYRKYEKEGMPTHANAGRVTAFAHRYDVSLDWLLDGDTSVIAAHLAKGKVAILPAKGSQYRERTEKYHRALLEADLWRRSLMPGNAVPKPEAPAPLDSA